MRCVVVGAGAWGLPAAAELARRGHAVRLIDRYGVGNLLSSSSGPTRLWRLTHPDAVRVRLARRGVEAMDRLASLSGRPVYLRRGLLWRDQVSHHAVVTALANEGVPFDEVAADDVGRFFPGLRPDGRDAVWQVDAGPLLAARSLAAQTQLFESAGGVLDVGPLVTDVRAVPHGVEADLDDGRTLQADVAVLAPGPGAPPLLERLGVDLPLRPHLEQVMHFGDPDDRDATGQLPCLFDGPHDDQPGLYAMPTPGVGYKVGLDQPLRAYDPGDDDRSRDAALLAAATKRVRHDLTAVPVRPVDAQVCSWTDSPDGRFVIDTLPGGIVLACGDCGEGFKFSALMGLVLADLAEGGPVDDDVRTFSLARFGDTPPTFGPTQHVLGR
ncbi:MAG TPA: FAD-dependent oxidoreductase [Actinomycetales bacterium]|nr:FAD-dependent oxidoreductase [Actinomycetales bacterium]